MERGKIKNVGLPNQCFLCKRIGHLGKEYPLSSKALLDVANDVPQTSFGGPWVQVAKRYIVKKTSHDTSKWKTKKENIYDLLTDVGERQTQLTKDLGNKEVLDNRHPGKEIVQEIQSRPDEPKFDV